MLQLLTVRSSWRVVLGLEKLMIFVINLNTAYFISKINNIILIIINII